MKILFFGDIMGKIGRRAVAAALPELKKTYQPDFVFAQGENLSHGAGITEKTLDEMLAAGIDYFTGGNHTWAREEEIFKLFEKKRQVLRPANFPEGNPGSGFVVLEKDGEKLLLANTQGRLFMKQTIDCPFRALEKILDAHKDIKNVFVDFHAEGTSEKVAFGLYFDGKVSAIVGTHIQVPTADARILSGGTAVITDVGMCGARDSVIGVAKEPVFEQYLYQRKMVLEIPEKGEAQINAVLVEIGDNGKATRIERVDRYVMI